MYICDMFPGLRYFFIAVYICVFDIKWSFEHVVKKETTGGVVTSHCELLVMWFIFVKNILDKY